MAQIKGLNAQDLPPEPIRGIYKRYSKISLSEIDHDPDILDLQRVDPESLPQGITLAQYISSQELRLAFDDFIRGGHASNKEHAPLTENVPVFTHNAVSGLFMIPSLFPPTVQTELISRLLHRDLPNPENRTNLHLHYDVTYPGGRQNDDSRISFFADDPSRILHPKDRESHSALSIQKALEKKLRWVTLGSQCDETANVGLSETSTPFPEDIAKLLRASFPETECQSAMVNFNSVGDTFSVHRDVSEDCDVGLISMHFGCDGLFLVSHDDLDGCEIIRLRSGDTIYMNGASRFAWHGVPKILPSTCPGWLADWPLLGEDSSDSASAYTVWKGWMSGKQLNLTVRQMTGSHTS